MKTLHLAACVALLAGSAVAAEPPDQPPVCYGYGQHCDLAAAATPAPYEAEPMPGWFYVNLAVELARFRTNDPSIEWGFEPPTPGGVPVAGYPLFWIARGGQRLIGLTGPAGAIETLDAERPR